MKLASTNKVGFRRKPTTGGQAQVRIILLALVCFLFGVGVTALWFHLAARSGPEISSSPTGGEPDAGQPAEPVINANPPARPFVATHPPVDAATIEEVKQAIPNFASVSLEEGTQVLREAALKQFTAAAKEMDAQVQQAQQQLAQAENGQSAAGQQTAMKHVQQIQAEQTEKLQRIAARLQAQIAALKQLKGMAP
jgi:hypothetical protein